MKHNQPAAGSLELVAHSRNDGGVRQGLEEHSLNVADLASEFAEALNEQDTARLCGLLHDLGKAKQAWQDRLLALEFGQSPKWDELLHDHKMTSAAYAWQKGMRDVAQIIAGHHGGMLDFSDLRKLMEEGAFKDGMLEACRKMQGCLQQVDGCSHVVESRSFYRLTMIFSCLVDADSIDTSRHFTHRLETTTTALSDLNSWLLSAKPATSAARHNVVALRENVRRACLAAVSQNKGFFSLTAATGSGKTLSGGLFATGHAVHHKMSRIIYVAPYRSIIDQTASVYKSILGDENVLAHHSTADFWTGGVMADRVQRQIAENWADIRIVVTTAEQFFESAYSSRPAASRKLHNIANSVVLIDELQAIPLRLLTPCIAFLKALVRESGSTVVVMTGTMPPLQHQALLGSETIVTPIVRAKSATCRRVRVFKSRFEKCHLSDVAAFMRTHDQALAIANTRSGAMEIYNGLPPTSRVYISTWLCPVHRTEIIESIRAKLQSGLPCHVASTQVIEAGVDFDFPNLLLREKAPLDSMIQAFGRCNRNGNGKGHCYIFSPASGNKLSDYDAGIDVVNELLYKRRMNPHDPRTLKLYYEQLYSKKNLDAARIMDDVKELKFQSVRDNFRLIADNQIHLVVAWGTPEQQKMLHEAIGAIKKAVAEGGLAGHFRWAIRRLQAYVVSLYPDAFERLKSAFPQGVEPLLLNYHLWKGDYSKKVGLGNVMSSLS